MPGLNCYSCPAASGACPIGSFQAVVGSSKYKFSYYITGFLILLGVLLGRFVCGFFVSVWLVTGILLHKVPTKKFFNKKTQATDIYQICSTAVGSCFITGAHSNDLGCDPYFCKYICPQGVLEGALPLSAVNEGHSGRRIGKLFRGNLLC